ncbi:MAG: hypothetical protein UU00_C0011G0003 [Microgenomates group bacterium GW2011_GWC1_40_35]|nr:MAG: hypothetical protein UU00_C0011G0003 [Microgenomates group bacterium GW2011_GWC1_40_35]KKS01254.1 MAG: hypothetical protein UU53_C0015G0008 [Candidatus Curtissbacteria bacterium GW2011_GWC2_41_21]
MAPNISNILSVRRDSFEFQQRELSYEVERGLLMHRKADGEDVNGYADLLSFNGEDFIVLTDEKIAVNGFVSLLDVGCGAGRSLIECGEKWSDRIKCTGVSAYPYHCPPESPDHTVPSAIHENGIEIKIADAQSLARYLRPESFDIITAVHAAQYLADPMAMLKGIHRVLRLGGVALMNNFPLRASNEDSRLIREFLQREYGFRFKRKLFQELDSWDLGFTKTRKRLFLPVAYRGIIEVTPEWNSFSQAFLVYQYKPSKLESDQNPL